MTLTELLLKLPALLGARASVGLVGPPGTGKTRNASAVARLCGPAVVINGGDEAAWKGLFPYRCPDGRIELGSAMIAAGFELSEDGEPVLSRPGGGTLVMDEFNRVPPELKSAFQLLGSERAVVWPGTDTQIVLDIAFVGTANDSDLGVEEAARAELDRFDAILSVRPEGDEIQKILAGTFPEPEEGRVKGTFTRAHAALPVSTDAAKIIYDMVEALAARLDPKKFHKPEGIRLARSIGRLIPVEVFGPADTFRAAAERCWPLGRRGHEKHRAEFDAAVTAVAADFAAKITALGAAVTAAAPSGRSSSSASSSTTATTLRALAVDLAGRSEMQISAGPIELPRRATELLGILTKSFGAGVALHLMRRRQANAAEAEKGGVKVTFGTGSGADKIAFRNVERHKVQTFCRLALA